MSSDDAPPTSHDNAQRNNPIVLERIIVAKSGLNTDDLDTVRLRINEHNFAIRFEEYIELLNVFADNARQFQEVRTNQSPRLAN